MVKRIVIEDTETGEVDVQSSITVVNKRRIPNAFTGGFMMLALGNDILCGKEMGQVDYRVFHKLMQYLDFENQILVCQSQLADELGMKKQQLSRSIKKLVDMKILEDGPKVGVSRTFVLNPSLGWRGTGKSHQNAMRQKMRAAGLSVIRGGNGVNSRVDTVNSVNTPVDTRDPNTIDWVDN